MYSHVEAKYYQAGGGAAPEQPSVTLVANGTYLLAAGLLLYISAKSVGGLAALNAGTTPGGTDLINGEPCAAGINEVFSVGVKYSVDTLLYITGITSSTLFTFYKL